MKDTAGQEKFHALAPIYYRDAEGNEIVCSVFFFNVFFLGAVLVYDITHKESFEKVN